MIVSDDDRADRGQAARTRGRRRALTRLLGGTAGLLTAPFASPASETPRRGGRTGYFYDPRMLDYDPPPGHPETPERLLTIDTYFRETGLRERLVSLSPVADPRPHIERLHTPSHVRSIRTLGPPAEAAALAVAGTLGACDAVCTGTVRNAFCAVRPPGHHSLNQGRQYGYCYYSTVAIAARYCQHVHRLRRVLIIDWDYHHGNGTEKHFYRDPSVLFFSTHNRHDFPGSGRERRRGRGPGRGYTINVHLGRGTTDTEMLQAWQKHLLPAANRFRPDIVLISAGFDSRQGDPLGAYRITDKGFRRMTAMALELADRHADGRLVSVLEGGYDPRGNALAAAAHVGSMIGDR